MSEILSAQQYQAKYAKSGSGLIIGSHRLCIGIDPDKNGNGVAIWDRRKQKILRLELMRDPALVQLCQDHKEDALIYLEAGHKINFIWGLKPADSQQVCASKGRDKGVNHGVAYSLIQWFEDFHLPFVEIIPDKELMKFTPDMVRAKLGYNERNTELISAARLVIDR